MDAEQYKKNFLATHRYVRVVLLIIASMLIPSPTPFHWYYLVMRVIAFFILLFMEELTNKITVFYSAVTERFSKWMLK